MASVFETKRSKADEKRVNVTIPPELFEAIEEIKTKLKKVSPDLEFSVNNICVDALKKAAGKAAKELANMQPHP